MLLAGAILLAAGPGFTQELNFPERQPNENRPLLPSYQTPPAAALALPPVVPPLQGPLSSQVRVFVHHFKLVGNTVFTNEELAKVTAPYENRRVPLTSEELQEVRHELTLYYVERGYINSGAVIPDQKVTDGVIQINIIEGKLTAVDITGNDWLRTGYIKDRLMPEPGTALNLKNLQQHLQLLQQNPLFEQLNAELVPGSNPGEGVLRLAVKEAKPYEVGVIFANDRPPAVGSNEAEFYLLHRNLTGWGDSLGINYGYGLNGNSTNDWYAFYTLPLNASDTLLKLWYQKYYSTVIQDPFNLDITSRQETYGIGLSHPFYRTSQSTFSLGTNFELRSSQTFLGGEGFSFESGEDHGKTNETVLRFYQEWLDRDLEQVIAARSTFSFSIGAFGATLRSLPPDGQFVIWLGQFQWARRFGDWGNQLIFRTDLQLADHHSLPALEKCAVGGPTTVRGYEQNQLVRDDCLISSLEFRIPLFRLPIPGVSQGPDQGRVQLAPFIDYGRAWNVELPTPEPKDLVGAGVGLRWDASPSTRASLYWGYPFNNINKNNPNHNLQDYGVYFNVQIAYP